VFTSSAFDLILEQIKISAMKLNITVFIAVGLFCFPVFSQTPDTSQFKLYSKLTGHLRSVEAVAWSPNGKMMASGGWDYDLHVYKADTPGFAGDKFTLKGHSGGITSVTFSKDGKFLASASKDFTIRVYNTETGELTFTANDHRAEATKVTIDPKSKYIISSSLDATLVMYDFQNIASKPKTIKCSGPVYSFANATDGKSIYVATDKPDIENIDFKAAVIRKLKGHSGKINCLEISPNGKMMASGSDDKTIIIWDLATGKVLKTLQGHTWKITSVSWSIDGNYLLSTCNDGQTKIWDLAAGTCLKTLKAMGKNARCAVWSPDMSFILVATLMDATNNGAVLYKTPFTKALPASPAKKPTTGKPGTPVKPANSVGTVTRKP
jgi:WD40 repeat protein